jgi:hypothetical protein
MAACKGKNAGRAKAYWKKFSQKMKDDVQTICMNAGISVDQLNAP